MKTFLKTLLILLILTSGSVYAQKSADDLIKQVVDKTRALKNLKIDFVYSMVNEKASINETKSGILYINGDAYRIELDGQLVISDGKTVWTYLEDSNEVMVSNTGDGDEAMTPSTLLTSYYKDYKTTFINDKQNTSKGLKTIELKPTTGKKFSKMQLGISESKLQLMNLSIFDNGGNVFTYDLNKMVADSNLSANFFQFNPKQYPGVEVVDMR
ncbi:MAG: outer membrane lipoprotein carrier protein LolA [Bacteroidetes bacterium]|nr:MAG: outer membrane lipoprotein carrier protein LolA [Bacteroidota bacterium]